MRKSSRFCAFIACMAIFLSSCQGDMEVLTIIDEGGNCMREIRVEGDRSLLTTGKYDSDEPRVADIEEGWQLFWGYRDGGARFPLPMSEAQFDSISRAVGPSGSVKDTVCVYARKEYGSVEEMCDGSPMVFVDGPAKVSGKLEKRFRWFYTDYVFTETFASVADYFDIPVTDYMSEEEARFWFTGTPDLYEGKPVARYYDMLEGYKNKENQWVLANLYYKLLSAMAVKYDMFVNPPVSKEEFLEQRRNIMKSMPYDGQHKIENDTLKSVISSYFDSDAYSPFFDDIEGNAELEDFLYEELSYFLLFYYGENIVMPGRVIDAGNGIYKDGAVRYIVDAGKFLMDDYEIKVTSRVVNVWAFLVTAAFASALCVAVIYRRRVFRR